LLGLLGAGVAAGAALGQVQSPGITPAAWLHNALAATTATGSAHVRYSSETTSPGSSSGSAIAGSGEVDFATGNFRVNEVNHSAVSVSTNGGPRHQETETFSQTSIAIGQTIYRKLLPTAQYVPGSSSDAFSPWIKERLPHDAQQTFGLGAGISAEDAVAGLGSVTPIAAVRTLGPGVVDGADATRYLVISEPLYVCGRHGKTLFTEHVGPTTVWVDALGRIVHVQTSQHLVGGPTATISASLTFSDFGAPVRLVAPTVRGNQSGSASITIKVRTTSAPCHR
jgi:hypothetical protein